MSMEKINMLWWTPPDYTYWGHSGKYAQDYLDFLVRKNNLKSFYKYISTNKKLLERIIFNNLINLNRSQKECRQASLGLILLWDKY